MMHRKKSGAEKLKAVQPDESRVKSWTHHLANCGRPENLLNKSEFGCLIWEIVLRTPICWSCGEEQGMESV